MRPFWNPRWRMDAWVHQKRKRARRKCFTGWNLANLGASSPHPSKEIDTLSNFPAAVQKVFHITCQHRILNQFKSNYWNFEVVHEYVYINMLLPSPWRMWAHCSHLNWLWADSRTLRYLKVDSQDDSHCVLTVSFPWVCKSHSDLGQAVREINRSVSSSCEFTVNYLSVLKMNTPLDNSGELSVSIVLAHTFTGPDHKFHPSEGVS